jgi:hypothetical protein
LCLVRPLEREKPHACDVTTRAVARASKIRATAVVGVVARRAPNSLQIYGTVLSLAYVSTFLVFPHSEASDSPRRWRGGAIPCTRDATTTHVPE